MIFLEKEIILKNGQKCLLRSPRAEEAEEMLEYLRTCAGETDFILRYPEEVTMTVEQETEFLKRVNESETSVMIVAVLDGEIAGSTHLSLDGRLKIRHRGTIGIAIKKKFWNLGLGKALLQELIDIAREHGCLQMELEVMEGNDRAIALYEKMGFEVYGVRKRGAILKDGTCLNMILMMKNLDE